AFGGKLVADAPAEYTSKLVEGGDPITCDAGLLSRISRVQPEIFRVWLPALKISIHSSFSVMSPFPGVRSKGTPLPPRESFQSRCGSVTTSLITALAAATLNVDWNGSGFPPVTWSSWFPERSRTSVVTWTV